MPAALETAGKEPEVPAGLWRKCNKCGKAIYTEDVIRNHYICPKCQRILPYARPTRRVESLADTGSFEEWDKEMEFSNPLSFPGYEKKWKGCSGTDFSERGRRHRDCRDKWVSHGSRRDGCPFLHGKHGPQCGRKNYAGRGARHERKTAGDSVYLLRRGQNAGRHDLPDADGKDSGCSKTPQRRPVCSPSLY